ncbi:MAG TPA: hypothetical protein VNN77_11755 [candidate division Zixibacteria bacterium]|nr:hypothetical protein [candidate division Zixibacteria bacterium]
MNSRLKELAARREALVARCDRDRAALAAAWREARRSLTWSGVLGAAGRFLGTHPILLAALSALFVGSYRRKVRRASSSVVQAWKLAYPLWRWWRDRRPRQPASRA